MNPTEVIRNILLCELQGVTERDIETDYDCHTFCARVTLYSDVVTIGELKQLCKNRIPAMVRMVFTIQEAE